MKRTRLAVLAAAGSLVLTLIGVSQPAEAATTRTGMVKVTDRPAHTFSAAEKQALKDRSAKKSINASGLSVSPNSIEVKPVDPVVPPTPIVQPYGSTPDSWTPMVGETL